MAKPFTVIIPHRDRPETLLRSLAKIRSRWGEWIGEFIVVDDASSSPACVSIAGAKGVTLLRMPRAVGPAACRNVGAKAAATPYLLFFDDDSWPASGDLQPVRDAFVRDPQLAAIGFKVVLGKTCESGGAFNCFIACGAAVKREPFLEAGGFPETYRFYVEEYALCYRLIEAGYCVRMWSKPAVYHAKAPNNRDPAVTLTQLIRNNRRLLEPQAKEQRIGDRLSDVLEWYRLLARRLGVLDAAQAAIEQPLDNAPDSQWSPELWDRLLGADRVNEYACRWREEGLTEVALWPVGKDAGLFIRTLGAAGIQAAHLIDPDDRFGARQFAGLLVRAEPIGLPVVVASLSPGLCWNARRPPLRGRLGPCKTAFDFERV